MAANFVQESQHLTDMGLATHILTGVILAISSIIVVYTLTNKLTILTAVSSTLIGLNPWFLQCISFRFDSHYMALSILSSVFPFLWWIKNKYCFTAISFLSLFLMCNTYQSSSGLFIIMVLALSFKEFTSKKDYKIILNRVLFSAIAYIFSFLLTHLRQV